MFINTRRNDRKMEVTVNGRLDTRTAAALEKRIKDSIADITELHLDFSEVEYISSAGLRVLLFLEENMKSHGRMWIDKVNDSVMEIFDITGFSDILTFA